MRVNKYLLIASVLLSSNAYSFSGVVTDIKSYTYYTDQIKNQVELIEKQESLLKKADESIKLADTTKKSLMTAYNKAKRQANNIQYDIQRAKEDPLGFAIKVKDSIAELDPKETQQEIEEGIDESYKFEATSPWQRNRKREEVAQTSVKRLMVLSDEAQILTAYNVGELESLIAEANKAETQKEATDVTNAILTEILKNQLRAIDLMAAYQSTFARLHYTNTPEEELKGQGEKYSKDEFHQQMTDGLKVDLDMESTSKSLFDGLKGNHKKSFN